MATIKVDPKTVDAGSDLTIAYTGGTPNTSVTLVIDNGGSIEEEVQVELDANGEGEVEWAVPTSGWTTGAVNGPNAPEAPFTVKGS